MLTIKMFDSEKAFGYKQITTFFQDFSIADNFGINAIRDTYKTGMEYAKTDYKVLTEFVMVLNWKIWEHHKTNPKYGKVYNELWEKADAYACDTLKGDELRYFYKTTD